MNDSSGKFGLRYAADVEADARLTSALRSVIAKHYYKTATPKWLASEVGISALQYEAVSRYTNACRWVVPWVHRLCNLNGAHVVDIGAGTGATTVAFAHLAARVVGYEIEERSIAAASDRFKAMDVYNCSVKLVDPKEQLDIICSEHPEGAQFVLLFAVVEHLTEQERETYLSRIWNELLRPGGYLIIVDTPNRLAYFDAHTSEMPFFHMLSEHVALRYYDRAPRAAFVEGMNAYRSAGEDLSEALHRWGLGASFHDFELAFGVKSLDGLIVANGFEWEMTNWFPPGIDDQALVKYFFDRNIDKDIGFARSVLNLIFRKPRDGANARPRVAKEHLQLMVDHHGLDPRLVHHGVTEVVS